MRRVCLLMFAVFVAPLLLAAESSHFTVHLSPSTEVPVVTDRQAVGEAHIGIHVTRDAGGAIVSGFVDFDVSYYLGDEEEIRAMHIHVGGGDVAGPVVIGAPVGAAFTVGPGSHRLFRQQPVDSDTIKDAIDGILANPSGYYLNIHSATHPRGIIRGPLRRSEQDVLDGVHVITEDIRGRLVRIARALGIFLP